jgi:hypothetical protein
MSPFCFNKTLIDHFNVETMHFNCICVNDKTLYIYNVWKTSQRSIVRGVGSLRYNDASKINYERLKLHLTSITSSCETNILTFTRGFNSVSLCFVYLVLSYILDVIYIKIVVGFSSDLLHWGLSNWLLALLSHMSHIQICCKRTHTLINI